MKIGVCLRYNDVNTVEYQVRNVKNAGFNSVQLIAWNHNIMTKDNAQIIKPYFEKYGVEISALWCGWEGPSVWNFYEGYKTLGLLPEEYRETRIKNLCTGSDFAKHLGVTDLATHMGFIPENPYDAQFGPMCDAIRRVAEYCKSNGQFLLFETGQETPVAMLRCIETVATDNLGINLDTANLILYGKANPVDALDVFGKYIRNIHAKDGVYPINGHNLGEERRIGDGKVDFRGLFIKLKELGYDSYVTIEREIKGEKQLKDIEYAKVYLENIITEIYGGDALC